MPTDSSLTEQLATLGVHMPPWPEEPEGGGATGDWIQRGLAYAEGVQLWRAQLRNAPESTKRVVAQLLGHLQTSGQLIGWDQFIYAITGPDVNALSDYQRWRLCTELSREGGIEPAKLFGIMLEMANTGMIAAAFYGLKQLIESGAAKGEKDLVELWSKLLATTNADRLIRAAYGEDTAWQKAVALHENMSSVLLETIRPHEAINFDVANKQKSLEFDQMARIEAIIANTNDYWVNTSGAGSRACNRFGSVDSRGTLTLRRAADDWNSNHDYGVRIIRQEVVRSGRILDILKNNRHRGLANILHYDKSFVYQEYVDGAILSNKNKYSPKQWKTCYLDTPSRRVCFKELRESIFFLHSIGVAHTDVTTFNVMVTSEGRLKLIDLVSAMPLTKELRDLDLWLLEKTRDELVANHGHGAFREG